MIKLDLTKDEQTILLYVLAINDTTYGDPLKNSYELGDGRRGSRPRRRRGSQRAAYWRPRWPLGPRDLERWKAWDSALRELLARWRAIGGSESSMSPPEGHVAKE